MKPLSEPQRLVYEAIEQHWATNIAAPSVRELCAITGLVSTGNVSRHVETLKRLGWLVAAKHDDTRPARQITPVKVADAITNLFEAQTNENG